MKSYENPIEGHSFWRDALAWRGAITRRVAFRVLAFGLYGAMVALVHRTYRWDPIPTSHVQFTAGLLVLLLVLRTNAGYDRWWEARKMWGGIVNQSRNLAIKALSYGPTDPVWQDQFMRWTASFCHAARLSLRGHRSSAELEGLLGSGEARRVLESPHGPSHIALRLAESLRIAREGPGLDGYAFLEIDRERALLIDYVGACERILRTPLPRVHSIKLRRFILIFLVGLPFAIGSSSIWVASVVTALVAYPLFAIDQIGQELENPFSQERESHLPLDRICAAIQANVMALAARPPDSPA